MKGWMRLGGWLFFGLFSFSHAAEAILQLGIGSGEVGSQNNIVQMSMVNDTTVIALQLEIADVPDFIRPDSIWTTDRSAGFFVDFAEDSLSVLHILVLSLDSKSVIAKGAGPILNISYTVLPGAENFKDIDLIFYTIPKVVAPGSVKIPAVGFSGKFTVGNTAVESREKSQPGQFVLAQNYPNPFNPETRIAFQLPVREYTRLEIYNVLGQRIRTLVQEELAAGLHEKIWDGLNDRGEQAAGGIYFYRLQAGGCHDYRQMLLMR
jgi:hypothetical protein